MIRKKHWFLMILAIEMADIKDTTKQRIEDYKTRFMNDEISNYVYRHNIAVMKKKLSGRKYLKEVISGFIEDDYNSLEDLIEKMVKELEKTVKIYGIPNALLHRVEKKIDKVKMYVCRKT